MNQNYMKKNKRKMNIKKEWDDGEPHNNKYVMVKVPVFISSTDSKCLLEIYKQTRKSLNNK